MSIRLIPVKFDDGSIGFQDDSPAVGILRWASDGTKGVAYHNATEWGDLPAWEVFDAPNPWKEGHRSLLLTFEHVALLAAAAKPCPSGDGPMFAVSGLSVRLMSGPDLGFVSYRVRPGDRGLEFHHHQLNKWCYLDPTMWPWVHIDDNNGFPTAASLESA